MPTITTSTSSTITPDPVVPSGPKFSFKTILFLVLLALGLAGGAYYIGQHGVDAFVKQYNEYRDTTQKSTTILLHKNDSLVKILNIKDTQQVVIINSIKKQDSVKTIQLAITKDSIHKLNVIADSLKTILPPVCDSEVAVYVALQKQDSVVQQKYDSLITDRQLIEDGYVTRLFQKDSIIRIQTSAIRDMKVKIANFPVPTTSKILGIHLNPPTWVKILLPAIAGAYLEKHL